MTTDHDDLIVRARKASEIMMAYEAWEMPAPAPDDPIDYGWTAQVIDDLVARITTLTAERDEAREALKILVERLGKIDAPLKTAFIGDELDRARQAIANGEGGNG